jgi:hypothetical protein
MPIKFDRGYIARIDLAPSTLAAGTIYWSNRNQGTPGQQIYVARICGSMTFIGTNAATRSLLGVHRKAGTPTGGTSTPPSLLNSGSPTGLNDCRFANAGLAGATIGVNDQFAVFAQQSQLGGSNFVDLQFEDENPFIVEAGEFFCIYAHAALVAGVGFNGYALWYSN